MTETAHNERPTLVLGGTGKTGRRVVARLAARGLPVRVGSRRGQPPFDWGDESTWTPVLQGARAAYIPYPDLVIPGQRRPPGRSPSWRSSTASPGWCC